ncbi:MAG: hypothetical protein NTV46_20050 [Verrucomicrobia bacterium]|nr:hypothetical protein [Verrucomicrobiota bacterium]
MKNIRLSTGFAVLGCLLLASCYPVNENPNQKKVTKTPAKVAANPDPQKIKEQEALKKKEQEELAQNNPPENPGASTQPTDKTKPPVEAKRDYAFANKVPGKDGFVFSPYNNKVVDVRDIPTGTLVMDPTYPAAEKKFFRVP